MKANSSVSIGPACCRRERPDFKCCAVAKENSGYFSLDLMVFFDSCQGISKFNNNLTAIADYLAPFIQYAKDNLPADKWNDTEIFLRVHFDVLIALIAALNVVKPRQLPECVY